MIFISPVEVAGCCMWMSFSCPSAINTFIIDIIVLVLLLSLLLFFFIISCTVWVGWNTPLW